MKKSVSMKIEKKNIKGCDDIVMPIKPSRRQKELAAKLSKLKGMIPQPMDCSVAITKNVKYNKAKISTPEPVETVELDPFKRNVDWDNLEKGPKTAKRAISGDQTSPKDTAKNQLSSNRDVENGDNPDKPLKTGQAAIDTAIILDSISAMSDEDRATLIEQLNTPTSIDSAIENAVALEVVEADSTENQGLTAIEAVEEYTDQYRVGIFLEDQFPVSTKSTASRVVTPNQLFEGLTAYATTTKSIAQCMNDIGITHYDYLLNYSDRFPEVARMKIKCDEMKVDTLHSASFQTYSQDITQFPEIAFKGDEEVARTEDTDEPLGELSPSWVKFEADKRQAYLEYAKYAERGHLNEKPTSIMVSNNTISYNAQEISLEKLEELDPMKWDESSK